MTRKDRQRFAREQGVLRIVGSKPMRAAEIARRFPAREREHVIRNTLPFLEREGFLIGNYDGGPDRVYTRAAR